MLTDTRVASIHQANTLLSANVFAHLQVQAQLIEGAGEGALVWHVVDHDDCRDRRFRQARFPALNSSPQTKAVSLPMSSGSTMCAVPLTLEIREALIKQLRGYVAGNRARLSDLAAWFGRSQTIRAPQNNIGILCDLICSSSATRLVELNIEIAKFFARSWLNRDVIPISSTSLYASKQEQVRRMFHDVITTLAEFAENDKSDTLAHASRWDWWLLKQDGTRKRSEIGKSGWRTVSVAGHKLILPRDAESIYETPAEDIFIPGVLADTAADTLLRDLSLATQYWRSEATVALANEITKSLYGRQTRSYFVGHPLSFELPDAGPPDWLTPEELEGFRSGIYSIALYWILGMESHAPPLRGIVLE